MTINCCKDCKNRFLGCHDNCAVYQERLKAFHAERQAIRDMYACARSLRTISLARKGIIASYK